MHVVTARRPGPPDVFAVEEAPDPEPGPGQVVVDVAVAAITFVDTQMRAGRFPRVRPEDFPLVLGNGVAGTVAAVGGGVDAGWLGAEVVTATGGRGGYATRAVAAVADLHRIPAGLDLRDAAALLADGRTALGLARAAGVGPDDTVAVTAAGGGVGSLLVQIARNAGATVVALAGGRAKRDLALDLGAAAALDYRDPAWPDRLAEAAPGGLTVAFDGVGGDVSAPLVARAAAGRPLPAPRRGQRELGRARRGRGGRAGAHGDPAGGHRRRRGRVLPPHRGRPGRGGRRPHPAHRRADLAAGGGGRRPRGHRGPGHARQDAADRGPSATRPATPRRGPGGCRPCSR